MRATAVPTERGCPVCCQRVNVEDGLFVLHRLPDASEECWGSKKRPVQGRWLPPCGCECTDGGFCGGCGHAGCRGRQEVSA